MITPASLDSAHNFYHLGFGENLLSQYNCQSCLLTGDPDRTRFIAENLLQSPQLLSERRGLASYLGYLKNGEPLLIATSGMGASSASIVINELSQAGIKNIIRLGTTGSIQNHIPVGSIIVSQAALCRQGAANDIAPIEYPAAADPFLTVKLVENLRKSSSTTVFCGITASVDTFYEGQERYFGKNTYLMRKNRGMVEEYQHLNILNFEMESGILFKSASVYGMKAACVCIVVANRTQTENVTFESLEASVQTCTEAIMETLSS